MRKVRMAHDSVKPEEIGARLILLREALGFSTSAAFARHVELTPQALNNYERGIGRPDLDAALKIVRRTRVTLDWVYAGEDSGLSVELARLLNAAEERLAASARASKRRARPARG